MKLHILLTEEIAKTKPDTCIILHDYGNLPVYFNSRDESYFGQHCILEDSTENILQWLRQHEYFIMGSGSPMFEQFRIVEKGMLKKTIET